MKARALLLIAMLLPVLAGALSCGGKASGGDELAIIETNYGRIIMEFFPDVAPKHVARFKELARSEAYDGTKITRIVKNQFGRSVAIQGGDPSTRNPDRTAWGRDDLGLEKIPAEISPNVKHVRGIVSAARKANDRDSFTSQFFIMGTAEPRLDGEYSIFGRVVEGMNIVDMIIAAPTWPGTEQPLDPVVVNRVYLIKKEELKTLDKP